MKDELLEAYVHANEIFNEFEFIIRNKIPFEEWPPELQAIAGVNEELLGSAENIINLNLRKNMEWISFKEEHPFPNMELNLLMNFHQEGKIPVEYIEVFSNLINKYLELRASVFYELD